MRGALVLVAVLTFVAVACAREPARQAEPAAGRSAVIAAVGDIACNNPAGDPPRCRYDKVADLIRSLDVDRFLALGDEQYLHGSAEQFATYYDRYFGDLKPITAPVPGNHELYTLYGEGYYDYFGKAAHGPGGYYSFDLGGWHLIALNSQICKGSTWNPDLGQNTPITRNPAIGQGCGPGTPMYEWLKKDLVLHEATPCTLAFFHHPLYGSEPWPQGVFLYQLQPLWELLDERGVDIALSGHVHDYQRFEPMDAFGRATADGMVQFVVGTGGSTKDDLPGAKWAPNRVAGQDRSYGVLKLTLNEGSADFEYLTAAGESSYSDFGTIACT
jgi:Calcineurin-like phosphoesterase